MYVSKLQPEIVFDLHVRAGWAQISQFPTSSAVYSGLWACSYMFWMWNELNSWHDLKITCNPSHRTSPWAWKVLVACVFSEAHINLLNHKENQKTHIQKLFETTKYSYSKKKEKLRSTLKITLSYAVWTIKLFHLVCVWRRWEEVELGQRRLSELSTV